MNSLANIFDQLSTIFTVNLSLTAIVTTYWFLFFVEFPRYYLFDGIVTLYYKFTTGRRRRRKEVARRMLYIENPLVTIISPGHNEGKHIYKLVESLREQTFKNFELIIIDDGSTDETPLICRDLEKAGYIDLYLRNQERGGKASAANYGAYFSKGKYIIHLDADSSLDRDAIENILIPFYYDTKIKAVGGTVKVRNDRANLCTTMQALEYIKTIQVGRMVTNALGIYHIISGAFGAFEAKTLKQVGYWDIGPGLDGDITQKIRKCGFKIYFAEDAICMTNVPTSWVKLFKQRRRWGKSLIRFRLRKHLDILVPNANFSFSNFISNLESILFDCIFNYVWFFYIINLFLSYPARLIEILVIGWIIRITFSLIGFGIIMLVTERPRQEARLIHFLWFNTIYTGFFLRICRLIAHTEEFFFFTSYKDVWNPTKTSSLARYERQ